MIGRIFLIIDPGSQKSGIALLDEKGTVLEKKACTNSEALEYAIFLDRKYKPEAWIFGDKGAGKSVRKEIIGENSRKVTVITADEHKSSEEGRKLYWEEHPPTGFRRLIPIDFQIPKEPWDDYAAVVIGRRWLEKNVLK
jgi:hypothetical protein